MRFNTIIREKNVKVDSLNWRQLTPQLNFDGWHKKTVTPLALQDRALTALTTFLNAESGSVLVLKTDEQRDYADILQDYIRHHSLPNHSISGVNYIIEQADSFSFPVIEACPAMTLDDNFAAKSAVEYALYFDSARLFGQVLQHPISHDLKLQPGLVHQVCNGVLILAVSPLLSNPTLWQRLKHLLSSGYFEWLSPNPLKPMNYQIPGYQLPLKVILLGDRETLAEFSLLEPNLYDIAQYAEVDSYFLTDSIEAQQLWINHLYWQIERLGLPEFSHGALTALFRQAVRESEDGLRQTINPLQLKNWLTAIAKTKPAAEQLQAQDVEHYFQQLDYQRAALQAYSRHEILREQIYICSEGQFVGEINGLSVIEYVGTPISYGEPSRITCTVQFGDGEIIDVERKSELAGNIHGKGTLLAQACLSNLLDLPAQLPFSASIAFEQSYADIDGDSASLAQFCVLVSALANVAIEQGMAITGAIDQGGLVHSVGGVNLKIEGFYAICQARGLNGKQGVIIPATAVENLSLQSAVVEAVKCGQFHIWAVENVQQAVYLLTGKQLLPEKESDEGEQSLAEIISQRIENKIETLVVPPFSKFLAWVKSMRNGK
ncbi:Lon protease family protein [Pasteurellaceae bacterium USgator11]|nr:Lon protease family protein [Pasteurellaceae bacterium UScroc12]TNG97524.1 Lon protease family protein [Pasteurellaceae bacterium USgator41]TNG99332.1 Lon protease family protein [Pasteurellaceae bacterium USgator11]TNG99576.1 Lon protease family protein [Pasteurellaceae bacterium UScroc31]